MADTDSIPTCLFCDRAGPFTSTSHILAESLAGPNSPVAAAGTTCDTCNHYFGQKVESAALSTFPFSVYRLFSSTPSKKGRLHSTRTTIGTVVAAGQPGRLELHDATEEAFARVADGRITQFRLLAEVTQPLPIVRMLIKVGIETLAKHQDALARSPRFAPAIRFCRRPSRGDRWWFALHTDPGSLLGLAVDRVGESEIEVSEIDGCAFSALRMPGLATLVPLEPGTAPPSFDPEDPCYKLIWAAC